ncbi:MAG: hypothetical protein ABMB14_21770 [Myxococcota bacterium]
MGIWVLTARLARAACDDPEPIVVALEAAATEGRTAEGEAKKAEVLAALACGRPVDPTLLARIWLADAVVLATQGDRAGSDDALAAAAHVAPQVWNDVYGSDFERRHLAATAVDPGTGRIVLAPQVAGGLPAGAAVVAAIDGHLTAGSAVDVPAGLHVVQLGFAADDLRFAQEIYVVPGQDLVVRAELPPFPVAPVAPAPAPVGPVPVVRKHPPVFAIASIATAVGAAATAAGASLQNGAMRDAQSRAALEGAYHTQQALGVVSYSLVGVTAACLAVEVAW